MNTDARILTFRVRRIPGEITSTNLADFLERTVDGGLGGVNNIQVESLARSPDDWSNSAKQTATLSFKVMPPRFNDENQTSWTIRYPSLNDHLLFNTDFISFTPLNSSGELYNYDCVAVSGLAGHAFGSWRQRNATASHQFMWLRDQLSKDFPKLRVLLYGYDTKLAGSQSSQDIDDLARTFIAHLKAVGRAEISAPPLIILAHSLGGIIVKRALLTLARSGDAEDLMLSNISLSVFFGVPNNGMETRHLRAMIKNRPNDGLVQLLSVESSYLKWMDNALHGTSVFRSLRLVSVYETEASATPKPQPDGSWARTGDPELLVSRDSAISKGSRDPQDIFHIDRNHSELVKFSPDDLNYFTVRTIISETLQAEPQIQAVSIHAPTGNSLQVKDYVVAKAKCANTQGIGVAIEASNATDTADSGVSLDSIQDNSFNYKREHSKQSIQENQRHTNDMRQRTIQDQILIKKSLAFEEADFRYGNIETARKATFDWVFENQVSLLDWIRSGTQTYWIRGKPGSGKSTLMKFLHDHQQFRQAITDSSFDVPQVDLWYFFNERGSFLQKSLNGLLRTILWRLIDQNQLFASLVADVYYSKPKEQRDKWSIDVLNEAFSAIVRQQQSDIRLIIFLDALDEFYGFPDIICGWIQHYVSISETGSGRTKIRICFSSRPWDSFLRAFDNKPGFALHLYTIQDMKYYTRQTLANIVREQPTAAFSILIAQSNRLVDRIVETIARRAEGVFIWVAFAIREVTATLKSEDSQSLESIVDGLPAQLDEFYLRSIMRISNGSRWRAFVMLELVLRSIELVTVKELFWATSCADGTTHTECLQLLEKAQEQNITELEMSRSMLNLCNGLLESAMKNGTASGYIQFIHRTVKDFVSSPGFGQVILEAGQRTTLMNGYTFWLKYEFVKQGRADFRGRCLWYAHMDERSNGRPLDTFINSIPAELFETGEMSERKVGFNCSSPFIFGVIADLRLLVQNAINEQPHDRQWSLLRGQDPQHALAWFVTQQMYDDYFGKCVGNDLAFLDRSSMSAMLLENGFDIQGKVNGITPFDILSSQISKGFEGSGSSIMSPEMISLAKVFMKKGGQNPDTSISFRDWEYKKGKVRGFPKISKKWSAIHVASHEFMKILLECGANPNILDLKGNTALDVCVGSIGEFGIHRFPELAYVTTKLLLDHGGLLTERGVEVLPTFLKIMKRSDYDEELVKELVQRFSGLPLLESGAATGGTKLIGKVEKKRRRDLLSLATLGLKFNALSKKFHKR